MSSRRPLSEFICREMLFEEATNSLDPHRKELFDESLKNYPHLKEELEGMQEAIQYVRGFDRIEITTTLQQKTLSPSVLEKFREKSRLSLPQGWKWSLQALSASILVGAVIALIPSHYFQRKKQAEVILSEMDHAPLEPAPAQPTDQVPSTSEAVVDLTPEPASPPTPPVAETKVPPPAAPQTPTEIVKNDEALKGGSAEMPTSKMKGWVYRAFMTSDQLDQLSPQVVTKIRELGGIRAGEVELGWKRQGGRYFHFSLPESNLPFLQNYLQGLSPVRMAREPHPRVMPDGQIRIILWLEHKKADSSAGGDNGDAATMDSKTPNSIPDSESPAEDSSP